MKTIDPTQISQPSLHHYLLTAIAPRPIAFASTVDKNGNVNLSPYSFFNVFSSNPPIVIFSPARSGRNLSLKHTHLNLREVPEVTLNIVNYAMVEQMSLSSTAYAKGINEFTKAGFTPVSSEKVKPPYVAEAPVVLECKVNEIIELGEGGGAGNLVIAEVVLLHLNEDYLNEKGQLDTRKLDLVGRMGGNDYVKANREALFQIPKPLRTLGIGVDSLPISAQNSTILTGNNLGRLGNVEQLPDDKTVEQVRQDGAIQFILKQYGHNSTKCITALHQLAKQKTEIQKLQEALSILIIADELSQI